MADHAAAALRSTDDCYSLPDDVMAQLKEENAWAVLIHNDTRQVVWQTDNLPDHIPMQYTLSDIAELTRGYVAGYPAFTGKAPNGLLVLGYPKDRFWKHTRASWDYDFIANLPRNTLIILAVNTVLIFLIYVAANTKLLRSIRPITIEYKICRRAVLSISKKKVCFLSLLNKSIKHLKYYKCRLNS